MKLLAKVHKPVSEQYKEVLFAGGIVAKVDSPPNSTPYSVADTALVRIYVPEEDFQAAVRIVKDLEKSNQEKSKDDSRNANVILLLIAVGIVLLACWFFSRLI